MPKITQTKVGGVFLKEVEPRKWRASWTDPLTKHHIRRVLPAADYREAERMVKEINSHLAQGKGFAGRVRGATGHTISDAVLEAIKHTDANEHTRKNYLKRFNAFAKYLKENLPNINAWSEVTPEVLMKYIEYCRRQKIAHDSLRLRIFVLRLTSNYMATTYPDSYRDVTSRIRIKRIDPPNPESETTILTPEQLRALFQWLREHDRMVYTWAILQGLCGLRLFEAAYLREQDFNPATHTISITESTAHKPKNRPSHRTIPIPKPAEQALNDWIGSLKIRHAEGYLFLPSRARSGRIAAKAIQSRVGVFTPDYLSRIWCQALEALEVENAVKKKEGKVSEIKAEVPKGFIPRKLRSAFVTALRTVGADFEVLQRYIGHRPASILSAHYDQIGINRLTAISRLADDLFSSEGAFQADEASTAQGG